MAKIGINIVTGSLQTNETIVGIDLGTTNSLVAMIHPATHQPIVLKEFDNSSLVPSVVYFDEHCNVIVGDKAKAHLETEPQRTVYSAKRLMGKSYKDVAMHTDFFSYKVIDNNEDTLVKVQVGEQFFSPTELSSFLLKELKHRAEHILKTPIHKAVITVPAYFNDTQRQATRDAGKLAGLDVLRILNEPTAASLAYGFGLQPNEEKTIAVYDLGGGTFDISILKISNGIFEVLSTNGNTYLGGDDFDKIIVQQWLQQLPTEVIKTNKTLLQQLRLCAERAKKKLTTANTFSQTINEQSFTITKQQLETLVQPLIAQTIICCNNALVDAKLSIADIDEVVMVGGSTRMPIVQTTIGNFFKKKVNTAINPDEAVALGAALQADILAGNNKAFLLLDVTPLSLGIETMGGLMDVLIPRNSKIPTKIERQYTTQKDGQGSMRIAVFQGERDLVKDNRKLAEFNLTGIPGMPAGLPKVVISFLINADGILVVTAKELRSGIEQCIEVKPQYGITDADVEKMLLESLTHASADIADRALVEAEVEAMQLLETTEKFLAKNRAQVTGQEMALTAAAMQNLQMALTLKDKNLLQAKTEELNIISKPYAERIMDGAIQQALQGKKV